MNKIAIVAVLAVIVAAGISTLISLADQSTGSTSSNATSVAQATSTLTLTGGSSTSLTQCPPDQTSSSNSSRGLTILLCFKTGAKLGEGLNLHLILRNDASTSPVDVASANMTITDANGDVVFHQVVFPSATVALTQGHSYEWYTTWNTGTQLNGIMPTSGIHHAYLRVAGISSETDLLLSS